MSRWLLRYLLAGAIASASSGALALGCDDFWSFIARPCSKGAAAWDHGDNELILSGYSYHLRSTYTAEKLRELNEKAWGGGWARSVTDADGDEHMLYAFAFYESHRKIEWNAGYAYTTFWGAKDGLHAGLGYTAFIVQRPDIAGGVPIPAVLPLAALAYGPASLMATFIPTLNNGVNNGSVLYIFGKYKF